MIPLSIPSPPQEWQVPLTIPFGWLHGVLPFVSETATVEVHTYALCIIVGIFAAVILANRRLTRRGAEPWIVIDVALWAVVFGIIAARFYHVFTHPADYFGPDKNFWEIFAIWNGGNAIFGSLIGGAVGVWLGCRLTGLRFWAVADAIAPGLLLAQALGRLGNYFNQELFGWPTDLPWGLEIDRPNPAIPNGLGDDVLFHPTFLYELIWNLVGFAVILLVENRLTRVDGRLVVTRRPFWQWGKVLGLYLIWYGAGRSVFETIRLDPSETFLGIRTNVWAAFAAIVLGLVILIVQSRRHPGLEPSIYRPGREWTPDAAVDSEETYSEVDESGDEAVTASEATATSGSVSQS